MINKIEAINIVCDHCGDMYQSDEGFTLFTTESDVDLKDAGWLDDETMQFCPSCHNMDHEGKVWVKFNYDERANDAAEKP